MVPSDISAYIEKLRIRAEELVKELADPDIYAKTDVFRKVNQEHSKLSTLLEKFDDCYNELTDINEREIFIYAFKLGARIMLAVMRKETTE